MNISIANIPNARAVIQTTSAEDLTYITEQYPPYTFQKDGKLQGISVDLLERIWQKMGVDLNRSIILLLPWTEGYQRTLSEKIIPFSLQRPGFPRESSYSSGWGLLPLGRDVLLAKRDKNVTIAYLQKKKI
ncbi:transporter substrate-binding domain-containing protein [Methanothrix soehngenii]|uniref:transporter substrate-binding domain-containing protein n=1 Tax=Methanothrix soehngenii TaxID=2223 RepID=UPI00300D7107